MYYVSFIIVTNVLLVLHCLCSILCTASVHVKVKKDTVYSY